jgi:hypothetical protein
LRNTPRYTKVVVPLIGFAHIQRSRPVFLLGTSQDSITAANGAAPRALDGVARTESVSLRGRSHETVFNATLPATRTPPLIFANRGDACDLAPPHVAPRIAAALIYAASVRVMEISSEIGTSDRACRSQSPHGQDRGQAVDVIADWMTGELP